MQIRDFIVQCIDQAGGAVEERRPNLLDAVLPSPLASRLGDRPFIPLALDMQALDGESDAELATPGSPVLDALIEFAAGNGRTASGHIVVERLRKKDLADEVERAVIISGGRLRHDNKDPRFFNIYYAQFNFRVTFLSDERRESLHVIPVNLWSNQPNTLLGERLADVAIEREKTVPLPDASRVSPEVAYQAARQALVARVHTEAARHEARVRRRFAVELQRINDYYDQVCHELRARRERENEENRLVRIDQKIEAAQAERERKLRDLGETHRLRMRATLTSARLLSQPKTFFDVFIDRGKRTRRLTLAYDSLLERVEPPVCESCHIETPRLHVSSTAELICPACASR